MTFAEAVEVITEAKHLGLTPEEIEAFLLEQRRAVAE